MRSLLAGSGQPRAADDMAALAWQLGAGVGDSAAPHDDGDGFGFATAASPLAAMLTEARSSGAPKQCAATDAPYSPAAARQQGA